MSTDAASSASSILSSLSSNYTSSSSTTTAAEDNQEMFLTLLVAQMKNQDPLNPTDTTEFTGQLTQYSILEQNITTNDLLESMSSQYSTQAYLSMTNCIGKDIATADVSGTVEGVQYDSDQAYFVVNGDLVDPADVTSITSGDTSESA